MIQRTKAAGLVMTGLMLASGGLGLLGAPSASALTAGQTAHRLAPRPPHAAAPAVITGPLANHGGPVQSAPKVYVDYWGWGSDPSGEQAYLNRFLSAVGGTSWLATVNQYGGGSPAGLLAGTWSDSAPVPASPSDAQIQAEAVNAANHFGTGTSANVQIVVATPSGHSTPGFGSNWCAYHGAVGALPNITYTDLPYMTDAGSTCGENSVNAGSAGTLDGVSIVEGHELAETITDPLLNAWIDAGGNEIGDKCAWSGMGNVTTSGGTFAMQPLWSNSANGCVMASGNDSSAPLLAVLGADGSVNAKAGSLDAAWVNETGSASQVAVASDAANGPLIAVLENGTVVAKEGGLSAGWVTELGGVKQIAVASDPVNGPLIAVLLNDGSVYAKEGSLSAAWVNETGNASQISVASDRVNGPLLAVLQTDGTVVTKEGSLSAGWVTELGGASQVSVASDPTNGPLIAVVENGTVVAKEGGLSAGWVTELGGASQIAVASDSTNGPLITVLQTSGAVTAKEGSLSAAWVDETGGASQIAVASDPTNGPLIAVVENGTVVAKQGGLSAGWVTELGGASQVSVVS